MNGLLGCPLFLTGLSGAGKSTVAAQLRSEFGLTVANVGDLLTLNMSSALESPENRAVIGQQFLSAHRPDDIFIVIREALDRGVQVLDGVRFAITCHQARHFCPETMIWILDADPEIRKKRLRRRLSEELKNPREVAKALQSCDEFKEELSSIRILSDRVIDNNGTRNRLAERVRTGLASIRRH